MSRRASDLRAPSGARPGRARDSLCSPSVSFLDERLAARLLPSAADGGADGDLARELRELVRRQRLLLERLSRAEELADGLAQDLAQLESAVAGGGKKAAAPAAGRADGDTRRLLRRSAEAGVCKLEIRARADGSAEVRVEGGPAFALAPVLGDLLAVLSLDGGQASDGLVGWKTLDEVAILLGKKTGRPVRRHTATQHIYRLRRELFARGGVNPFLVQTHRRLGARFALRRAGAGA